MKTLFKAKHWPLFLDLGVIALCILVTEQGLLVQNSNATLVSVVNVSREAWSLLPRAADAGQVLALLVIPIHAVLFYIAGVVVGTYFLPVIYFGFIKARLRVTVENRLYATEKDLYYFRDTFPGMKATTVSLLVRLKIDPARDVPASLLQMVNKGLLKLEGNGFAPGGRQAQMSESEGVLARFALGGKLDLPRWQALCIKEATATGYLQKAGPGENDRLTLRYWIVTCVCWVFAISCMTVINSTDNGLNFFGAVEGGLKHLNLFFITPTFTQYVLLTLLFWFVFGALMVGMALPVYMVFYGAKYKKLRAPVRRTSQGQQVARLLYGIKNYIHDFTLLSEATQNHVALWNDFLVYAIVLEENTDIVDEVGRRYPAVKLQAMREQLRAHLQAWQG